MTESPKPALDATPLNATHFLIASKQMEIHNLEYFISMGQLVVMVSDLIHALQRERGASNLYLGAQGEHFGDILKEFITSSDLQIRAFDATLRDIYPEMMKQTGNSRLLNRIAYALQLLANLPQFRDNVLTQRIATQDAIQGYSETVSGLLTIIFETADAAADPTIARVLVALFNLMHGKELTGQERALGSGGFASGHFTADQRERLQYLIEAEARCFEWFCEFTDPKSMQLWQHYADSPCLVEIERLRCIALSEQSQSMSTTFGDQWFQLLTRRIDDLKMVELGVVTYLQRLCVQQVNAARYFLTEHQDLLYAYPEHPDDTFVVLLSPAETQKAGIDTDHEYPHPEGMGKRLGRSIFQLVQDQAASLQHMQEELTAARAALEDRKLQERAKALLMKHRKLTEDQAHKLLRQMAMDQGKRLTDIARSVVAMEHHWR